MKAALIWILSRAPNQRPKKVLVAVPVCSPQAVKELLLLSYVTKLIFNISQNRTKPAKWR
jgi:predicted phosphoribosyltransferase